jgi:hypothetical protein
MGTWETEREFKLARERERYADNIERYRANGRAKIAKARSLNPEKFAKRNAEWNRTHRGQRTRINKRSTILAKYGLREADYDAMLAAQGGSCAMCHCFPHSKRNANHKYFSIDHDHETGYVRGLLCVRCNLILEEEPYFTTGAEYLRVARERYAAIADEKILRLRKVGDAP